METSLWMVSPEWYRAKERTHVPLWEHVRRFIRKHGVKSILEIGGGPGYAAELVERYMGVDVNPLAFRAGLEIHRDNPGVRLFCADWLEFDVSPYAGQYDLVMAHAVVEHCSHYKAFIRKCLLAAPRFVMISFHTSLRRERDRITERVSKATCVGLVYLNGYAKGPLCAWLDSIGLRGRHNVFHVRRNHGMDGVLEIDLRPEKGAER